MKEDQLPELLQSLGDFTSKDNWDKFFTLRGNDDSFEWYAEWPELRDSLLFELRGLNAASAESLQILVPGCGNSRLSEHLYDACFRSITNIDFSKVVISGMLSRYVRSRPGMRWRVMNMTSMQFADETFDAVVDKGGLDALMEPDMGVKLGNQYLSEVRRVLKPRGKFICLTLAESNVLGLFFSKFRFGWKITLHNIPFQQKPSSKYGLQTFMVVAEKDHSTILHQILPSFNYSFLESSGNQASGLYMALENENRIRTEYSNCSDVLYSLEDLQLGARGDLKELCQDRRIQLTLGEDRSSRFSYRAVLLDARQQYGPFLYHCGIFLVPKTRAHEWLFSSEEGQWMVVESSKAARLVIILLDISHTNISMNEIQVDLSPLVKQIAPAHDDDEALIPFMMAGDGIKQRKVVHQVKSDLTGLIIVEDVVYENVNGDLARIMPNEDLMFRRLTFQRSEGLVQSEALLRTNGSTQKVVSGTQKNKAPMSSKHRKRVSQRRDDEESNLNVYHEYLASSYHAGIISGFMLVSSYLESSASTGKKIKAVVIGLGAGLLPMFLHSCMPYFEVEVVELDPVVLDLARKYFGFTEDKWMKVHMANGITYVGEIAKLAKSKGEFPILGNLSLNSAKSPSCESCATYNETWEANHKVDILIVDVDSSDSRSGLSCPASDFVEDSFLVNVKDSLTEQGLCIINLVSRSEEIKDRIILRMKLVFSHIFCLQLEEDVNMVLFALQSDDCIEEDNLPKASLLLEKLLKLKHPEMIRSIVEASRRIKYLGTEPVKGKG